MRAVAGKSRTKRVRRPWVAALLTVAVSAATLAACGGGSSSSAQPSPSSSPTTASALPSQLPPETLTFGVFGSADEVAAYQQVAALFAPLSREVTVKVESWPDAKAMMAAFADGDPVPDVFLACRRDLPWLIEHQMIQPVDQLLDERGVDFGDGYPRSTPARRSAVDNRLQLPALRHLADGHLLQHRPGRASAEDPAG